MAMPSSKRSFHLSCVTASQHFKLRRGLADGSYGMYVVTFNVICYAFENIVISASPAYVNSALLNFVLECDYGIYMATFQYSAMHVIPVKFSLERKLL